MYSNEQIKAFIGGILLTVFCLVAYFVFCINTEVIADRGNQQQIIGFLQAKSQPLNVSK